MNSWGTMETDKLKSLMHDSNYYIKSFHAYAKNTEKFAVLEKWGDNIFPELIGDRLSATLPPDSSIDMLGIGSGSGEIDSKMAAHIKSRFKSVKNVVLEPSAKQLEMYRSLVENKKSDFKGIEFDLRQLSIDEYRAQEGDQTRKFHFISAVHSLYYVQDYNDTIRYLYDCLEEGGILLAVLVSDDSGYWRLWDHFTLFRDTFGKNFSTKDLRYSFSSLGVPFDENHQSSRADITSCFEEGSEDGKLIIDFLTHMIDFRGTAPPEFYQEVVDYVGSEPCSERKEDGTILFNNDWDAVIVQKSFSK